MVVAAGAAQQSSLQHLQGRPAQIRPRCSGLFYVFGLDMPTLLSVKPTWWPVLKLAQAKMYTRTWHKPRHGDQVTQAEICRLAHQQTRTIFQARIRALYVPTDSGDGRDRGYAGAHRRGMSSMATWPSEKEIWCATNRCCAAAEICASSTEAVVFSRSLNQVAWLSGKPYVSIHVNMYVSCACMNPKPRVMDIGSSCSVDSLVSCHRAIQGHAGSKKRCAGLLHLLSISRPATTFFCCSD